MFYRRYFKLPIYSSYNSMAGSSHSMTTANDMKKMYRGTDDLELFVGGIMITKLPVHDF